jgi:hypothetical protein
LSIQRCWQEPQGAVEGSSSYSAQLDALGGAGVGIEQALSNVHLGRYRRHNGRKVDIKFCPLLDPTATWAGRPDSAQAARRIVEQLIYGELARQQFLFEGIDDDCLKRCAIRRKSEP